MDKLYCGSGKEKKFDGGGSLISVTLDLEALVKEYNNHGYLSKNGTSTIKITVSERRAVGQYGDTHTVTLDTWHPESYQIPQPIKVVQGQKQAPTIGEENEPVF